MVPGSVDASVLLASSWLHGEPTNVARSVIELLLLSTGRPGGGRHCLRQTIDTILRCTGSSARWRCFPGRYGRWKATLFVFESAPPTARGVNSSITWSSRTMPRAVQWQISVGASDVRAHPQATGPEKDWM